MPYSSITDLPDNIKKMPESQQKKWMAVFNSAYEQAINQNKSEAEAEKQAFTQANGSINSMEPSIYIELAENLKDVKLLYPGKFKHGLYGAFEVTEKDLQKAVENFNQGVATRFSDDNEHELPFNYQHSGHDSDPEKAKASGWIRKLYLKGRELFAQVAWTEKAIEYIKNKEFRYISPEFHHNWIDETGAKKGFTILGAALTNVNFLKSNMPAVVLTEDNEFIIENNKKEEFVMENKLREILNLDEGQDVLEAVKKLTENTADYEKKNQDFETEIKELKENLDKKDEEIKKLSDDESDAETVSLTDFNDLKSEVKNLTEENIELQKSIALKEANEVVEGAIKAGKILPKQRDRFVRLHLSNSKETAEMLNEMQPVIDLKEKGSEGDSEKHDDDPTTELNKKAEKLLQENSGMKFREAVNKVLEGDDELKKRYFEYQKK